MPRHEHCWKKDKNDPRNNLIIYTINLIKKIKPKYVFIENVPQQLKTFITSGGQSFLIPDYLKKAFISIITLVIMKLLMLLIMVFHKIEYDQ